MTDDPNYAPRVGFRPDWGNVTYCDHENTDTFHQICTFAAVITLPIDFIGVYFILKKSPKEMSTYKWFLLGHQICILLMDLHMSLLVTPEFTFPIWGCKLHGLVQYIGLPAGWIGSVLGLGQLGSVLASVMSLFYYRSQIVLPHYHFLKHSDKQQVIFYVSCFVINILLSSHFAIFIPVDQFTAKKEWFQKRVCVQEIFFDDNTFVLHFGPEKYYFYFLLYYMFVVIALFIIMVSIPLYYLTIGSNLISQATRNAQRMFLFALFVQVMVPFSLGIAPVFVYLHVRHWYFERQMVNNSMLIIESLHGSFETLIMLCVTTPYRNAILCRKGAAIRNSAEHIPSSFVSSSVQNVRNSGAS